MNTFALAAEPAATASSPVGSRAGQYLIFFLGREEYGIQVPRIREIISRIPLELAPGLPFCVMGLVNILGKSIPVVDLRLKLGLPETAPANRPLKKDPDSTWAAGRRLGPESEPGRQPGPGGIVMIDIRARQPAECPDEPADNGGAAIGGSFAAPSRPFNFAGIVVDRISEIVNIRPEDIEPAASIEGRAARRCALGLVRAGHRTKTLLDIDLALNLDSGQEDTFSRTLGPR